MRKITVRMVETSSSTKPIKSHPEVERFCNDLKTFFKDNPSLQMKFLSALERGELKNLNNIILEFTESIFEHEEYDMKL